MAAQEASVGRLVKDLAQHGGQGAKHPIEQLG